MEQVSSFNNYEAIVVGASTGGMETLRVLLSSIGKDFRLPIIIVQHLSRHSGEFLIEYLARHSDIEVRQAKSRELIESGKAYLAPANYHLLIESDLSFSLSLEGPVNFSRPSIDVLFESASDVFREKLIGVIMTGANADGSQGLCKIKNRGGFTIVENPETAVAETMPQSAVTAANPDRILVATEIGPFLAQLLRFREGL